MHPEIQIIPQSPNSPEAQSLMQALSDQLRQITGSDGTASVSESDFELDGSLFVVAYRGSEAIGCGGLRPINSEVAEIKRMYAQYPGQGIGGAILGGLEAYAQRVGYKSIWLETRKINKAAVRFYLGHGYRQRSNYGKYIGRDEAICFEKEISPS